MHYDLEYALTKLAEALTKTILAYCKATYGL